MGIQKISGKLGVGVGTVYRLLTGWAKSKDNSSKNAAETDVKIPQNG